MRRSALRDGRRARTRSWCASSRSATASSWRPPSPTSSRRRARAGCTASDGAPTPAARARAATSSPSLRPLRRGQTVVAFAAETEDLEARGRRKMEAKGADLVVVNDVGREDIGFEADENEVLILSRGGRARRPYPGASKREVADRIWDAPRSRARRPQGAERSASTIHLSDSQPHEIAPRRVDPADRQARRRQLLVEPGARKPVRHPGQEAQPDAPDAPAEPTAGCTGAGRPATSHRRDYPGHLAEDAAAAPRRPGERETGSRRRRRASGPSMRDGARRCTGRPGTARPSLRRATRIISSEMSAPVRGDPPLAQGAARAARCRTAGRARPGPAFRGAPPRRAPGRWPRDRGAFRRRPRGESRSATSRSPPPPRRRGSASSRARTSRPVTRPILCGDSGDTLAPWTIGRRARSSSSSATSA